MGSEILDHAHVGDAGGEGPLPTGGHLIDLAELAGLDASSSMLKGRVVPLDMTDGTDESLGLERLGKPCRGGSVLGQRLFDEGMNPGVGQGHADALVKDRRHRDHAVVEAVLDQRLDVGLDRATTGHSVDVAARVRDGDEVDAVQAAEDTSVVAPHHP